MPNQHLDFAIGQVFGRLTVLSKTKRRRLKCVVWKTRCLCGAITYVVATHLKNGSVKSCGCLRIETLEAIGDRSRTHGATGVSGYATWTNMRQRCMNPRTAKFPMYGGRGIRICARWESFACFIEDMGPRPSKKHSIERIDNAGDYEPGNCRWATAYEQSRNRRSSISITRKGRTMVLMDWCKELGMRYGAVYARLVTRGWGVERALTTPSRADHTSR